jgi:ASC-1-like (ASCH) protein
MHHLAIMKKSWGLLEKILNGEKKIESRWYVNKHSPWGKIVAGDIVYFKNSGESVSVRAKVEKILSFSGLTPKKGKQILNKYAKDDGIEKSQIPYFFNLFQDKKYCLLIFLKNPQKIKQFNVNKIGFGAMSAWITVKNIDKIKI